MTRTGSSAQAQKLNTWWRTSVLPRWQALAPRERVAVGVATFALGTLLVWWIALAPALRTLREVPPQRAALEAALTRMQREAAETTRLRTQPPVPPEQAQAALRAATERLGGKARLAVVGDRATVTFNGVEGPALLAWLGEVRTGARARPIEAQLKRLGRGYDGTLTLAFAGTAP